MPEVYSLAGLRGGFTKKQWFSLPLPLRVRWWQETDYGKQPPSDELKIELHAALRAHEQSEKGADK